MPSVKFSQDSTSSKDANMRIQFHIINAEGLSQAMNKQAPKDLAAFVSAEGPDIDPKVYDCQTDISNKKDRLTWNENLEIMDLSPSSLVSFSVIHRARTAMGLLKSKNIVLGKTDTFTVAELFKMQGGHDLKSRLVLPLHNDSKSSVPASLVINVRELLTLNSPRFRESLQKDIELSRKKDAAQLELEQQLNTVSTQLHFIERTSTSTAINDLINVALGVVVALRKVSNKCQERNTATLDALSMIIQVYLALRNSSNLIDKESDHTTTLMKQPLVRTIQTLFLVIPSILGINRSITSQNLLGCTKSLSLYKDDLYKKNLMTEIIIAVDFQSARAVLRNNILEAHPKLAGLNPVLIEAPYICQNLKPEDIEIVKSISEWIASPPKVGQANIFWLYGAAGCGKSQIAGHLADSLNYLGYFGTYFSFDPINGSKNTLGMLAGTLAYQLSISRPELAKYVSKAIEENPSIMEFDLQSQFKKLFIEPLVALEMENRELIQEPFLIILDELDQCGPSGLEGLDELLALLAHGLHDLPSFVHILAISRPVLVIAQAFDISQHIVKHLTKGPAGGHIQWNQDPVSGHPTMAQPNNLNITMGLSGSKVMEMSDDAMLKWIMNAQDIILQSKTKQRGSVRSVRSSVSSKHRSSLSTIKELLPSEYSTETEEMFEEDAA